MEKYFSDSYHSGRELTTSTLERCSATSSRMHPCATGHFVAQGTLPVPSFHDDIKKAHQNACAPLWAFFWCVVKGQVGFL